MVELNTSSFRRRQRKMKAERTLGKMGGDIAEQDSGQESFNLVDPSVTHKERSEYT